jgi:hypothetical protein
MSVSLEQLPIFAAHAAHNAAAVIVSAKTGDNVVSWHDLTADKQIELKEVAASILGLPNSLVVDVDYQVGDTPTFIDVVRNVGRALGFVTFFNIGEVAFTPAPQPPADNEHVEPDAELFPLSPSPREVLAAETAAQVQQANDNDTRFAPGDYAYAAPSETPPPAPQETTDGPSGSDQR